MEQSLEGSKQGIAYFRAGLGALQSRQKKSRAGHGSWQDMEHTRAWQ
jgi:hypothetical protein